MSGFLLEEKCITGGHHMSDGQIKFRVNSSSIQESFPSTGDAIIAALTARVNKVHGDLQKKILGKVDGGILKTRTHKLSGSVRLIPAVISGDKIVGGVQAGGGPALYAKFLEDGSAPHVIMPKDPKGVLAFMVGGKQVFAHKVNHPGTKAYLFMKGTLAEEQTSIVEQLQDAVKEATK
jgi:hypothetical protein